MMVSQIQGLHYILPGVIFWPLHGKAKINQVQYIYLVFAIMYEKMFYYFLVFDLYIEIEKLLLRKFDLALRLRFTRLIPWIKDAVARVGM
jgi:hypothetical protein